MKRISTITLLLTLSPGCSPDRPEEGGGSTGATGACVPGEEGCGCGPDDQCFGELMCLSDLCVEGPESLPTTGEDHETTGPKPDLGEETGGTGETGETGSGGTPSCSTNDDCLETEACASGYCYDTDWLFFETYVEYFSPSSCADGYGGAELYFRAYENEEVILTSSNSTCPGEWLSEADAWRYDSLMPLRIDFWEDDSFDDDYITGLCWQNEFEECTAVPKQWLHEGGFEGSIGDHGVSIIFVPELY